jgi:uridine kinase
MLEDTNIILVCGGSCSGKTTLAKGLTEAIREFASVEIISMDNYYYDLTHMEPVEADNKNFDSPDAVDSELLFRHLKDLQVHKKVREQRYDFKSHSVTKLDTYIKRTDFIVLEGIFALYFEKLRDLAAVKIFVHADADIRLARRVERDIAMRHLPIEMVLRQYLKDVRPMHDKYIEPYGKYADLILNSNFTSQHENKQKALTFIQEHLTNI